MTISEADIKHDVAMVKRMMVMREVEGKVLAVLQAAGLPEHEDIEILLNLVQYLFRTTYNPLEVMRDAGGRPQ